MTDEAKPGAGVDPMELKKELKKEEKRLAKMICK